MSSQAALKRLRKEEKMTIPEDAPPEIVELIKWLLDQQNIDPYLARILEILATSEAHVVGTELLSGGDASVLISILTVVGGGRIHRISIMD